jgi:hypothetical protein
VVAMLTTCTTSSEKIPPKELVDKIKAFCSSLTKEQLDECLSIESDYVGWLIGTFLEN